MFGAVLGDFVGSRFEFSCQKSKDFEFLAPSCLFTDDTVCTAAVADILLNRRPPATALQDWCRRYPGRGYGGYFRGWIAAESPKPYRSYGNGAAMRVSPAAFIHRRRPLAEALAASDRVTGITHDHPEGMKGARAATHAIWLAFQAAEPDAIRETIAQHYEYDLSRSVPEIRETHEYNETCQQTVPEAITCALESDGFEDAIRNAVSLGGDADTLAAIAGAIAEALHTVPDAFLRFTEREILKEAPDILAVLQAMTEGGRPAELGIPIQRHHPIRAGERE